VTPDVNSVSDGSAYVRIVIFSIGIAVAIACIALAVKYKTQTVIRAASLPFVIVILLGVVVQFVYGIIYGAHIITPTVALCQVDEYIRGFAFCAIFGSLLVKTLRLRKIFFNKKLRKKKMKHEPLMMLCALLFVDFAISSMRLGLGNESLELVSYNNEVVYECRYDNEDVWEAVFMVWRLVIILATITLTYLTRNLPSLFNESKSIAFVTYNASFFFLLERALIPLLEGNPQALAAITVMASLINGMVVLGAMAFAKFYIVWFSPEGADEDSKAYSTEMESSKTRGSGLSVTTIQGSYRGSPTNNLQPVREGAPLIKSVSVSESESKSVSTSNV
jgi:metabotropic glutamate receptor 4/metabotropic glutamate receptor 6/7/8